MYALTYTTRVMQNVNTYIVLSVDCSPRHSFLLQGWETWQSETLGQAASAPPQVWALEDWTPQMLLQQPLPLLHAWERTWISGQYCGSLTIWIREEAVKKVEDLTDIIQWCIQDLRMGVLSTHKSLATAPATLHYGWYAAGKGSKVGIQILLFSQQNFEVHKSISMAVAAHYLFNKHCRATETTVVPGMGDGEWGCRSWLGEGGVEVHGCAL